MSEPEEIIPDWHVIDGVYFIETASVETMDIRGKARESLDVATARQSFEKAVANQFPVESGTKVVIHYSDKDVEVVCGGNTGPTCQPMAA